MDIKPEMQRFLISTVFGYDIEDENQEKNYLKEACIGRAYLDLARVIPYRISTSKLAEIKDKNEIVKFKNEKESFKNSIKYILMSMDGKNTEEVISDVYNKAKEHQHVFEVGKEFTYGMAQKWVNMTVKYYWLFDCSIPNMVHVPIDSYIIDAIWKETSIELPPSREGSTLNRKYNYKKPSDYVKPWSEWDDKIYIDVQEKLLSFIKEKEHMKPLKWESEKWLEIMKVRRKTEMSKE